MLDIIPAGSSGGEGKAKNRKQKPNVVELSWKLPVRLRRPVSDDFKRRTITTKRPTRVQKQMGVEHHTGDVYRNSRAEMRLPEPPYTGKFSRGCISSPKPVTHRVVRRATQQPALGVERDLAYKFTGEVNKKSTPSVERIVLPRGRLRKKGWTNPINRKLVFNMTVLLVGCLLVYGLFWNLQGLGRGLAQLGPIRDQIGVALGRVLSASGALAETDFVSSEQDFADAQVVLTEAQTEMERVMGYTGTVLRYLDVTGTVRAGQDLLTAGEALTRAGQHVSRGLEPLFKWSEKSSLVEAIGQSQQELIQAVALLEEAEQALKNADSPFLPQDIAGQMELLQESVPRVRQALTIYLDQSSVLLTVLGAEREREYLLLFMNNHELRPTGGFIGSIALVSIDRGVVEKIDVESVYDGDGQLKDFIAPPDPLLLVTNRWYLRDTNWFVDWPVSAAKTAEFFEKEGGPTVDGVIALTPEVVRELLGIVGEVDMPQYDVVVTADNFWDVVQREVTYEYNEKLNRPKQFLADLTPILLGRLMTSSADQSLAVLNVLSGMLQQKNILMYFRDDNVQERLKAAGWAGEIPRNRRGLLAINNANIGGHKSDQFIEQDVDYQLDMQKNGDVDVMLTIRRTHRGPEEAMDYVYPKDENPAQKDNVVYQRVLVSEGAELKEADGFATEAELPHFAVPEPDLSLMVDPEVAEWQRGQVRHETGTMIGREAGYTFFANWVVTAPGETSVTFYRYRLKNEVTLPTVFDPAQSFEAYVFKQPGQERTQLRVVMNLPETTRIVHTVPEDGVTQHNANEVVYRGMLQRDGLVGAVFEKSN
ncbi:MAG: DUF4012 domain-containing protein [bacterium]